MECPTTDVAEAKRHAAVRKVFMIKYRREKDDGHYSRSDVDKVREPSLVGGSLAVLIQKPHVPSQGRNSLYEHDIPSMWGNTKSGVKKVVQGHRQ